jgi:hypothetical protein
MTIFCSGKAKLLIPETGEIIEVSPDDLEWEIGNDSEERSMGEEIHYYSSVCLESKQGCRIEAEWDVWEYPIGTIERADVEVKGAELLKDFDAIRSIGFNDDDIYEDQLDAILDNTKFYDTLFCEIKNLRVLNELTIDDVNAQKALKRLIYIGTITCVETYLSDAFINTVLSKKAYLKSFFSSFKDFKERKLTMNDLLKLADNAEGIAKEAMVEVLYHNLPKVKKMYELTLNISFPDFSKIINYIGIRHDLVHRNGKSKQGEEILIDKARVDEVITGVMNFVDLLEKELERIEWFGPDFGKFPHEEIEE